MIVAADLPTTLTYTVNPLHCFQLRTSPGKALGYPEGNMHTGRRCGNKIILFILKGHPPSTDLRYGEKDNISPSTLMFATRKG